MPGLAILLFLLTSLVAHVSPTPAPAPAPTQASTADSMAQGRRIGGFTSSCDSIHMFNSKYADPEGHLLRARCLRENGNTHWSDSHLNYGLGLDERGRFIHPGEGHRPRCHTFSLRLEGAAAVYRGWCKDIHENWDWTENDLNGFIYNKNGWLWISTIAFEKAQWAANFTAEGEEED